MYHKVSITLAILPTALPETMMGSDYELCMSMYELNLAQNRKNRLHCDTCKYYVWRNVTVCTGMTTRNVTALAWLQEMWQYWHDYTAVLRVIDDDGDEHDTDSDLDNDDDKKRRRWWLFRLNLVLYSKWFN